MGRKFFVGGNWKLNGNKAQNGFLISLLNNMEFDPSKVEVVVSPVAIYLESVRGLLKKEIGVAAQNCHFRPSGAFTGEIAPNQLKDINVDYVILGHSERRSIFKEDSAFIAHKVHAALEEGLKVILCCGESEEEREQGKTEQVVFEQLKAVAEKKINWTNVVIAYEPVWAIGTGKVATPDQAQQVHSQIRNWLKKEVNEKTAQETRIIYGGSVSGGNCGNLNTQPDIDGFLVGGASLKVEFESIVKVYLQRK